MPPAVSSSNSSSSLHLGLGLGVHLVQNLFARSPLPVRKAASAASSGAISSTMSAAFSGSSDSRMLACILGSISESASAATSLSMVSKIASRSAGPRSSTMSARSAGCMLFQLVVGDVQPQPAQRVGLHHVAEFPADGIGRDAASAAAGSSAAAARPAAGAGRCCGCRYPLPARDSMSRSPSLRISMVTSLTRTTLRPVTSMICWSSRSRADAQHVLVVVVGNELFVAERNALAERDVADLVVADGEPGVAAAHQETVDARADRPAGPGRRP